MKLKARMASFYSIIIIFFISTPAFAMFTGSYEPIPGAGQLVRATTSQAVIANFKAAYLKPFKFLPIYGDEEYKAMSTRIEALQMESQYEEGEFKRNISIWFAGMFGYLLNPLSLIFIVSLRFTLKRWKK